MRIRATIALVCAVLWAVPALGQTERHDGEVEIQGALMVSGAGDSSFVGNVGIGTDSPSVILEIVESGKTFGFDVATTTINVAGGTLHINDDTNTEIGGNTLFVDNPNVGIGTVSPGALLDLQQGAADGSIFELQSTDMVNPITDFAGVDAYGAERKISATGGGRRLIGIAENNSVPLNLQGYSAGTNPTDTVEAVEISCGVSDGGTGVAAIAPAEECLQVKNLTTNLVTVLGGGNVGIGTVGPGFILDVQKSSPAALVGLNLSNTSSAASANGANVIIRTTGENNTGDVFTRFISKDGGGSEVNWSLGIDTSNSQAFVLSEASVPGPSRFIVEVGGNVGIGTDSPGNILEVVGASAIVESNAASGNPAFQLSENGTASWDLRYDITANSFKIVDTGGGEVIEIKDGSSSGTFIINGGTVGVASLGDPFNRLEIGVNGNDGTDGVNIIRTDSSTETDNLLGGIGFDSIDGNIPSSILEAAAFIAAYAAEDHGTGDKGGYLTFGTSLLNEDDDTVSTEHMIIDVAGNVGIADTSPTHTLDVTGTYGLADKLLMSSTAPTLTGFGTSPSIVAVNGTVAFTIDVGTGGTASSGNIILTAAPTGWHCNVWNLTALANNDNDERTTMISTTTTTVVVENQAVFAGTAFAWSASDILSVNCFPY